MTRVVIFFVVVAALAAVAVWIADEPGRVVIAWGDWQLETSPAALAAAAAIFAAFGALLFQLARWLWLGPRAIARARQSRRQRRGYLALTQGLVSAAAGDPRGARRLARRANLLLGEPPLTLLLSAQAAQLEGEDELAKAYFEAMLERPETEFLGLRGLLVQAHKAGDNRAALALAERAFALRPHTPWVLTTLLELQSHAGQWTEALTTLRVALRQKALEGEAGQQREAGLLLEQARAARAAGDGREAAKLAERALDAAPQFIAAILFAAGQSLALGRRSQAERIIARAWADTPHPVLAQYFNEIHSRDDALARAKHFENLTGRNPEHPESHLLLALSALESKLWGAARNHLQAALKERPSAGIYRRLAQLEEAEHDNSEAARRWLMAASEARPDPLWVCAECGAPESDWSLACTSCGALDRMQWRQPAAPPAALEARPETAPSDSAKAPVQADGAVSTATGENATEPA
ncbi:MAG: heme biosynthesis HemY N-terminal domain-containing protein [Alphaproteobacteria bacterium]|nr:heme biosynthesis HemY N-terminal domain-containing protein [Alphaproteobacteria bacterium]